MKTYQQLMNEIAPTGAQVKVTRRTGSGVGSGDTRLGGGVSFSNNSGTRQGNVNLDIGRTTQSGSGDKITQGVTNAIEKPGVPSSTSSPVKSRVTANVSGNLSARSEPEKKEPPKPKKNKVEEPPKEKRVKQPNNNRKDRTVESPKKSTEPPEKPKVPFKDTVEYRERRQQNRLKVLQRDNKFKTKYRYAVPTSKNAAAASGANQYTDWEDKGKNKTGGTNFVRTKVVGDPRGGGGTGRTVSQGRYDRLFGPGGKYEPGPGTGNDKYPSTKLGKPFNPKGYQPSKFTGGKYSSP